MVTVAVKKALMGPEKLTPKWPSGSKLSHRFPIVHIFQGSKGSSESWCQVIIINNFIPKLQKKIQEIGRKMSPHLPPRLYSVPVLPAETWNVPRWIFTLRPVTGCRLAVNLSTESRTDSGPIYRRSACQSIFDEWSCFHAARYRRPSGGLTNHTRVARTCFTQCVPACGRCATPTRSRVAPHRWRNSRFDYARFSTDNNCRYWSAVFANCQILTAACMKLCCFFPKAHVYAVLLLCHLRFEMCSFGVLLDSDSDQIKTGRSIDFLGIARLFSVPYLFLNVNVSS